MIYIFLCNGCVTWSLYCHQRNDCIDQRYKRVQKTRTQQQKKHWKQAKNLRAPNPKSCPSLASALQSSQQASKQADDLVSITICVLKIALASHYLPESEKANESNCGRKESNKGRECGKGPQGRRRRDIERHWNER
jgi:hypothetical protein